MAWKRNADANWEPASAIPDPANPRAVFDSFLPGESIDIRVRHINTFDVLGAWNTSSANTVGPDWIVNDTTNLNGIPAADVTEPHNNLVADPSGRHGSKYWTVGGNWSSINTTEDGWIWTNAAGGTSENVDLLAEFWMPVVSGVTYTLSGDLFVSGYSSGVLVMDALSYQSNKITLVTDFGGTTISANTSGSDWERVSSEIAVTGAAAFVQVRVFTTSLSATIAKARKLKFEKGTLSPHTIDNDGATSNTGDLAGDQFDLSSNFAGLSGQINLWQLVRNGAAPITLVSSTEFEFDEIGTYLISFSITGTVTVTLGQANATPWVYRITPYENVSGGGFVVLPLSCRRAGWTPSQASGTASITPSWELTFIYNVQNVNDRIRFTINSSNVNTISLLASESRLEILKLEQVID